MSDKKDINKKFEQKMALERVIKQSFNYHEKIQSDRERETIENMMEWNKENLSPNGGKKAFVKTQKEQMTKKPRTGWLSRKD